MSNDHSGEKIGDIVLGQKYRDRHTGYEGIATAVTIYLYGCRHVLIESGGFDKEGKIDTKWFEEERIEGITPRSKHGGPMPHPPARH